MRKFPQLKTIEYELTGDENHCELDGYTLNGILHYLSDVKNSSIRFVRINRDTFADAFRSFWEAKPSLLGTQHMKFEYADTNDTETFGIWKLQRPYVFCDIKLKCSAKSQITEFIQKNGKFLKSLTIDGSDNLEDASYALSDGFMAQIYEYCPHLQNIHFRYWIFEKSGFEISNHMPKLSLAKLSFENCSILSGALEDWSQFVSEIKLLTFAGFKHVIDNRTLAYYQFTMPHTRIHTIIFWHGNYNILYVKLLALSDNNCYYYKLIKDSKMKTSNEKEYAKADGNDRIYICCQSKPVLKYEYPQKEINY